MRSDSEIVERQRGDAALTAVDNDWGESVFATNVVFEPLLGELFRSNLVQQIAAQNGDFVTPTIIGAMGMVPVAVNITSMIFEDYPFHHEKPGMALWREKLFVSLSKNATKASEFFQVPTNRVVELGTQVEL